MDVYNVNITDLAKQDIRDIALYITTELHEPVISEKNTNAILDAILTLEEMPYRIGLVKDNRLAELGIRPLYVNNYTVFFSINESEKIVNIVRVIYSRRDWITLLQ
jgi:plasmid stabilization system protein ParE